MTFQLANKESLVSFHVCRSGSEVSSRWAPAAFDKCGREPMVVGSGGNWLQSSNAPSQEHSILQSAFGACNQCWSLFQLQNQGPAPFRWMRCKPRSIRRGFILLQTGGILLQVSGEESAWKNGVCPEQAFKNTFPITFLSFILYFCYYYYLFFFPADANNLVAGPVHCPRAGKVLAPSLSWPEERAEEHMHGLGIGQMCSLQTYILSGDPICPLFLQFLPFFFFFFIP